MSTIACWNVRGFNQPFKRKEVRELIRVYGIGFCAILETHVDRKNVELVFNKLFNRWHWTSNMDFCEKGCRIVLGWDTSHFDVMEMFSTSQVMHCLVKQMSTEKYFHCSVVYATNDHVPRRHLWHSLEVYNQLVGDSPWLVLGDFNAILMESECAGGILSNSSSMSEFRESMMKIELMDLHYGGLQFTWSGSPHGIGVVKKLDRVLVNSSFTNGFAEAKAMFLPRGTSDHSPGLVDFGAVQRKKKTSFRFQNFLAHRTNFVDMVRSHWGVEVRGVKMYQLVQKLKCLKPVLRAAAWSSGNLSERVDILKVNLLKVQTDLDCDPFNEELKTREVSCLREYREAALEEERLLKHHSKVHWLKVGDNNNKFFHKSMLAKKNRSRISSILNDDGVEVMDQDMNFQFVSFYKNLLGSKDNCDRIQGLDDWILKIPDHKVPDLIKVVCDEEIKLAMFNIGDEKAPGPDGYTSCFFKSAWNVLGKDVCKAVKEFFRTGKLLKEVNASLISLIPKVQNPQVVGDYRPIALCNVIYKCISKILANRIKECLDDVVDPTQNAFIPGRRISDNILLTQELFKNYHRHKGIPRCAFKVDIKKAYDSVDWVFLIDLLHLFGFLNQLIGWIKECITTPSYSIILNGEAHGFFPGQKGLRQGDPLSPYLFTLVMQALSSIIKKRIDQDGRFNYHPKCEKLGITHLCFADDLFLFSSGDPWSVQILKDSLDEFGSVSGLWPNEAKSNVYFCKVARNDQNLIKNIMGFQHGSLPVRYLGVPLFTTRLFHADCIPLIDQVKRRLLEWQNKWLSFAGRLQLAISVLSSMQVFWASMFILPVSNSKEIEKLIRNFIWGGAEMAKGKAKVAWKDVCLPKLEGGLGLKPLFLWNKALMAFHLWSVVVLRQSLWVKWIHTYRLKGRSFWEVKIPWDASWSWKKILGLRDDFRPFIRHSVGDGQSIWFWHDSWTGSGPLINFFSYREISAMGFSGKERVADFYVNGQWKWPCGLLEKVPGCLEEGPLIDRNIEDKVFWRSRNGTRNSFKTSLVWKDIRIRGPRVQWHCLVWFSNCIPKHAFILWLAIRRKLMTQDRMQFWQSDRDLNCAFCHMQLDSVDHLFFECQYSSMVYWHFRSKGYLNISHNSWDDLMVKAATVWKGKSINVVVNKLILGALVYLLWQERNWRLFQNSRRSVIQLIGGIEEVVRLKIMGLNLRDTTRVRRMLIDWRISTRYILSKC